MPSADGEGTPEDLATSAKSSKDISVTNVDPGGEFGASTASIPSTKHGQVLQAGQWLDRSKRPHLFPRVAAQFQTPLQDTVEDAQLCHSFWRQARELGLGLHVAEIPRRLRLQLVGATIEGFQRRQMRWLENADLITDDVKMSTVMLNALNELILAAHAWDPAEQGVKAAFSEPATLKDKVMAQSTRSKLARVKRKHVTQGSTAAAGDRTDTALRPSSPHPAELLPKLVQEAATAFSKWHLVMMRRSKGSLSTAAVKLASDFARALATLGFASMAEELHTNAAMIGNIVCAVHKLAQLAASLDVKGSLRHPSLCSYFLHLSGNSMVEVEVHCFTAVSLSVELLAVVWPNGFSDFDVIQDMPKPPRPNSDGRLYAAVCDDTNLCRCGIEFNRRLMKELDQGTDSLILCCAYATVDAVLDAVKQVAGVRTAHENSTSNSQVGSTAMGIESSIEVGHPSQTPEVQMRPQKVETVDLVLDDGVTPDHATASSSPADGIRKRGRGYEPDVTPESGASKARRPQSSQEVGVVPTELVVNPLPQLSPAKSVQEHKLEVDLTQEEGCAEACQPNGDIREEDDLPIRQAVDQTTTPQRAPQAPSDDEDSPLSALLS
jgi:hypothetical protein